MQPSLCAPDHATDANLSQRNPFPGSKAVDMDANKFERVSRELLDLLDQHVAAIANRRFEELTREEVKAYERRKRRILKLRSALAKLLKSS